MSEVEDALGARAEDAYPLAVFGRKDFLVGRRHSSAVERWPRACPNRHSDRD